MKNRDLKPKKPLFIYYIIVLVIIFVLNLLIMPTVREQSLVKTDYSAFLESVSKGTVKKAEIRSDYIYYLEDNGGTERTCRTVRIEDPQLVDRLLKGNVAM